MSDIRVLHTEWSDGWGGQEIRIINEMLAVREQGIEVFLACRGNARIKEEAERHNIPVFVLPFRGNADLRTLFALRRIVKKQGIDIVNTHSGKDTWVGGLAAKLAGAKFIRTRHLSNPINPARTNFINGLADYVLTTGESVREDMIRNNRIQSDRIESVPTGIDETLFDPGRYDRAESRAQFGIHDDEIAIGIVAVLRGFKRHDLLLEVAGHLIAKYPRLRFIIAGEGPKRSSIEKTIQEQGLQDHVLMLGHVDEPQKVLAALDIFTLTSDSKEGVPQSVMQAMLMGLPVVATASGSTRDLLHDDNFILVEPGNVQELEEGLERLIKDEQLRAEYSRKARAYIVEHFSKSVMVQRLLRIYNKLTVRS
jgi:glycosyltransferase involved in cell wall biosynthesis